jgi:acetyl esterase/lipase
MSKVSGGFQWLENETTGDPSGVRRARDGKEFSVPVYATDPLTGGLGVSTQTAAQTAIAGTLANLYGLQAKAVTEQSASVASSRAGYEDTASTIFTEAWASASANWAQGANPCQVSGGALFAGATQGGGSGQNHSFAMAANENLRAVFALTIPAGSAGGGVIIGVSKDAAGAAPAAAGANAFGLYTSGGVVGTLLSMDSGATTALTGQAVTAGSYIVTVTVDQTYISVVACKTDGTNELYCRRLRAGFAVNNLYLFNSDARALTGQSVGLCSARKGLQTIAPRTFSEGAAKTIHWSGDGTQSWMVFLPAAYDSRKPTPVVMCFHGNGTDETAFISNGNYSALQRACVNAGYIVLSCALNASKTTWGNAASTDAYYAAYKFLRDNYAIGPVAMFANSMGGIESLNALAANKIPGVVAWVGTSATTNLAENYANALFTGVITSAYGISGGNYATQTAGKDPNLLPEYSFRQLPMLFITPTDDVSVTPSANALALIPKMQGVCPVVTSTLTTGGHSFAISPFLSQITAFFDAYAK